MYKKASLFCLAAIVLLALWGCVTPGLSPAVQQWRNNEEIAVLKNHRDAAWARVKELVAIYEQVDPAKYPGLSQFCKDLRETCKLTADGHAAEFDVDTLTIKNPQFWRAMQEVAPNDPSFLLLHASLLTCAGEIWRSHRILGAVNQLMTIDRQYKSPYLAPLYSFGYYQRLQLINLAAKTGGKNAVQSVAMLDIMITAEPRNSFLLDAAISSGLRAMAETELKGKKKDSAEALARIDAYFAAQKDKIQRLRAIDPLSAAEYIGDADTRKKGRKLFHDWERMVHNNTVWREAQIAELKQSLFDAEVWELGVAMQRIQAAMRGFAAEADIDVWRRALPPLIGEEASKALTDAMRRGEILSLSLNSQKEPTPWNGDPRIHPAYLQQLDREIAENTFEIENAKNSEFKSKALMTRAYRHAQVGLFDEARADFIAVEASTPLLQISMNRLQLLTALAKGDVAQADSLAQVLKNHSIGKMVSGFELGCLAYYRGDFATARTLFAKAAKDHFTATLLADLAARRAGSTEIRLVGSLKAKLGNDTWAEKCVAYLMGETTQEALLAAAQDGAWLTSAEQECQTYFVLAQIAFGAGKRDEGIRWLDACVNTGITGLIHYYLAVGELKRVAPEKLQQTAPAKTRPEKPLKDGESPEKSVEEEVMGTFA